MKRSFFSCPICLIEAISASSNWTTKRQNLKESCTLLKEICASSLLAQQTVAKDSMLSNVPVLHCFQWRFFKHFLITRQSTSSRQYVDFRLGVQSVKKTVPLFVLFNFSLTKEFFKPTENSFLQRCRGWTTVRTMERGKDLGRSHGLELLVCLKKLTIWKPTLRRYFSKRSSTFVVNTQKRLL